MATTIQDVIDYMDGKFKMALTGTGQFSLAQANADRVAYFLELVGRVEPSPAEQLDREDAWSFEEAIRTLERGIAQIRMGIEPGLGKPEGHMVGSTSGHDRNPDRPGEACGTSHMRRIEGSLRSPP